MSAMAEYYVVVCDRCGVEKWQQRDKGYPVPMGKNSTDSMHECNKRNGGKYDFCPPCFIEYKQISEQSDAARKVITDSYNVILEGWLNESQQLSDN